VYDLNRFPLNYFTPAIHKERNIQLPAFAVSASFTSSQVVVDGHDIETRIEMEGIN
jgi:hypothetical protein